MTIAAFVVSLVALSATIIKAAYDYILLTDSKVLIQLKTSLENAYNSLEIEVNGSGFPVKDRFQWITAARHIARYTRMKRRLSTRLYKAFCDESKEYWKTRFYLLLDKIPEAGFYSWESLKYMPYENIQPKSLAVIISFIKWGEKDEDPLDDISLKELVKKNNLLESSSSNYFFTDYLRKHFPELLKGLTY